jgi:tetratricopeptide (TPR) repeat protein
MFGEVARRGGSFVSVADAPAQVSRRVLPAAGARAPASGEVRWGSLETDPTGWRLTCDAALAPPLLDEWAVREIELGALTEEADDRLAEGDHEGARSRYLALLERSPRDPDLARRIADLDRATGVRDEAGLSTLRETMPLREAGLLAAELLERTGARARARSAYEAAAEQEPHGALAALALLTAARIAPDDEREVRRALIDKAVARAPALGAARWLRIDSKLEQGDLAGAIADAEHLEAAARGAHARHDTWRRLGEALLERGHAADAVTAFERSLRYSPDSPAAVAGLSRSLYRAGRKGRALDLSARAVELSAAEEHPSYAVVLGHARALAEWARDLPHAVAHLRSIPVGVAEAPEARALEGRYRAELGDKAGASLAFAAMREAIEAAFPVEREPGRRPSDPASTSNARRTAAWLRQAAAFEREAQGDPRAAQLHLALALHFLPRDASLLHAFREVCAEARAPMPVKQPIAMIAAPKASSLDGQSRATNGGSATNGESRGSEADGSDEQRAETLADRLRADPGNHALVLELTVVLERLGRDFELFAVLAAAIEDSMPPARDDLLPRQRAVLARLIARAESDGRTSEAALYRDALGALGSPSA